MPFNFPVTTLANENPQDFIDLANGLTAEHKPETITEEVLVAKMAQHIWFSMRAMAMQSRLFQDNPEPDQQRLSLYVRMGATNDRALSQCLKDLARVRNERREREIGSVSQKQRQEMHDAKVRNLHSKSATQELELEVRSTVEAPLPGSLRMPFETLKSLVSTAITDAAKKLEAA